MTAHNLYNCDSLFCTPVTYTMYTNYTSVLFGFGLVPCKILVPQTATEPTPLAETVWSPNRWTVRERSHVTILKCDLAGVSTLAMLCNITATEVPAHSVTPNRPPVPVKLGLPPPHSAPAPDKHFLSCGFARVPHTRLPRLPSFCWRVYKVHPCWSHAGTSVLFVTDQMISHWMNICILFIQSQSIFFWQRRPRNFIREVTIFQQMVLQQLNIPNLKKPKTNLNLYLT